MSGMISKNQSGFTLVELMVSLVISLFLMAGLVGLFISNKQVYRVSEASSRVQENGRFAFSFLKKDVRMAGFMGCVGTSSGIQINNNVDTSKTSGANLNYAISGFDGTDSVIGYSYATGSIPAGLSGLGLSAGTATGNIMPDTDVIVIKRGEACTGGQLVNPKANANFKIADNSSCGIQKNDVVLVSNCQGGDFFAVVNTVQPTASPATLSTGSSLNINNQVSADYGTESEIFRFQVSVFYVGVGANGDASLFSRNLVNGAFQNRELVENIEDMTITYGVDSDGDRAANYFVGASGVTATDWENVVSIRITVDARSPQKNITQSTVNSDRRLRHSFTGTIKIRNRI